MLHFVGGAAVPAPVRNSAGGFAKPEGNVGSARKRTEAHGRRVRFSGSLLAEGGGVARAACELGVGCCV